MEKDRFQVILVFKNQQSKQIIEEMLETEQDYDFKKDEIIDKAHAIDPLALSFIFGIVADQLIKSGVKDIYEYVVETIKNIVKKRELKNRITDKMEIRIHIKSRILVLKYDTELDKFEIEEI